MAAELFPGRALSERLPEGTYPSAVLEDDGYYWHLYPYFESAKLPSEYELIDLYGGNEIAGYELDRLKLRLNQAALDLQWRSDKWPVTIGWNGTIISRETERNHEVRKDEMTATIERLLSLIEFAKSKNLKLCVSGD